MSADDAQAALGLDDLHLDATVRELAENRLVEQERHWLRPTAYLAVALIDTIDYSPSEDDRTVAKATVDAQQQLGGSELAARTGLSSRRLNHAVRRLDDKGAIDVSKAIGTAPYAFYAVRATGATLRYLNA